MADTPDLIYPGYSAEQQNITRQQKLADMLRQQAMQGQQSQMVSGHYIGSGLGGMLANLFSGYAANKIDDSDKARQLALAQNYGNALKNMVVGQDVPAPPQVLSQVHSGTDIPSTVTEPGTQDTGQIIPPSMGQMVNATPPPANGMIHQGGINIPGMSDQEKLRYAMMDMPALVKAGLDQYGATDLQKNSRYMGISSGENAAATRRELAGKGLMDLKENGSVFDPSTQKPLFTAPTPNSFTTWGANGLPTANMIPGSDVVAQRQAQAVASGSAGGKLPFEPPTVVDTPGGKVLMTPAQQIAAANKSGGMHLQSPQQQKVEDAKAEASIGAAKMQAAADPLLQVIKQARAINPKVPSGGFGIAEGQAALSTLPGMDHGKAANAALWEQMTGQSILNTIQNLAASGGIRMDIPIVKEIQKAGGIPLNLPPEARSAMLDQLESEVRNRLAAAKNTTPQLNQSNLGSSQITPMVDTPETKTLNGVTYTKINGQWHQ